MVTEKIFEQDIQETTETETFHWTKQWYPVAVIDHTDTSRPYPFQLLGKNLVLWRNNTGKWSCFEDVCPHRLVPLSEGRVESDGTLMCAYHAWRFNSEGKCVSIPQSKDKETEAKNCTNSKSCAVVYPTQERQGLLWVWLESGEKAQVESKLREPRVVPELENPSDRVVKLFWSTRDLPYGWDLFMENVSDPAHVPVSHHGFMGSRYTEDKYYDMIPVKKISTQEGFSFEITPFKIPGIKQAIHDFQPPCHMRIVSELENDGKFILVLYAVPTRPGWCRHIGCQVLVKDEQGKRPKGLAFFGLPMPDWLGHVLASLFVHQDLVFLHYQEKIIANRQEGKYLDLVYTPNPQDKMVITFRKWLEKRAGGGIPWAAECNPELPPPEYDKRKLFDVWETHTKDCRVCQDALKNINRLKILTYVVAGLCLCLGIIIDARAIAIQAATGAIIETATSVSGLAVPPLGFWFAVGGAALFAFGGYKLQQLSRLFYVYEFEHADND
ncbi:(2Fe-2S)-binding protein [Hydrocoleum sp. CS-953]|uniref:aromatic ring-hydroxylating dioxygenase subunit alpha n=1 Tax=Hydrocoleum sp. CS-953 TaxID=1671698 RepID=UPI000B9BB578|nr:Rieske 2Fe-2S domain-containing protein [Hydrocoleum sp. CS-953]OZH55459.1 (2Fe-2S)-binding protein [Hydrocoleum sp. CS-953]